MLPKIFLSHATEDKVPFVRDLAVALSESFNVWYDEYSLLPGGSIFQSISGGLAQCDFAVVVLSKSFFEKKWTQAELGGLFVRESATLRRIIPVWKDVTLEEVTAFSPILADRRAVRASEGVPAVVSFVVKAVEMAARPDSFVHTGTVVSHFSALGKKLQSFQTFHALFESPEGAKRVMMAQNVLFDAVEQQAGRLASGAPQLGLKLNRVEYSAFPRPKMQLRVLGPCGLSLDLEANRPANNSADGAWCDVTVFRINPDWRDSGRRPSMLEDHRFMPVFNGTGNVAWQDSQKQDYAVQELCDFAFQLFHKHIDEWLRRATGQ